jgi:hypothetical protein
MPKMRLADHVGNTYLSFPHSNGRFEDVEDKR